MTINEIADRANVNRGTVYLHYEDKFDLLDQCIETHMAQLFESCLPSGDTSHFPSKASLLRTVEYLEQHAFSYTTLLTNKGVPAFRKHLLAVLRQGLSEQIEMSDINRNMNKEILVQYLASAAVGVLEWWITRSIPYPAKDMAEQLWALMERNQMVPQPSD
ncbi:TetR/AcrR family transcriptional regulator [Paenibacillus sp. NPDC056579]|uniref:TetR/AcrR family transcriptional regulator n=1 Tax=Paenibacillus sp. NPDC056579 TaxID=3345871 RepID=UPI0036B0F2E8